MTAHIDTLRDWWNGAERGVAHVGDTVIYHDGADDMYQVYTLGTGQVSEWRFVRILHRAPKPKPAWHDAVAVIAHTYEQDGDDIRRAFVPQRDGDTDEWRDGNGIVYCRDDLASVTPLIEAKVTDGMVQRAVDGASVWTSAMPDSLARAMLTAALGLDPE